MNDYSSPAPSGLGAAAALSDWQPEILGYGVNVDGEFYQFADRLYADACAEMNGAEVIVLISPKDLVRFHTPPHGTTSEPTPPRQLSADPQHGGSGGQGKSK